MTVQCAKCEDAKHAATILLTRGKINKVQCRGCKTLWGFTNLEFGELDNYRTTTLVELKDMLFDILPMVNDDAQLDYLGVLDTIDAEIKKRSTKKKGTREHDGVND